MITDDVIGHAKQKQYIVQWDFIYHEMMAVQNLHREYSGMIETMYESVSHQASSQAITTLSWTSYQIIQTFVTQDIMSDDLKTMISNKNKPQKTIKKIGERNKYRGEDN